MSVGESIGCTSPSLRHTQVLSCMPLDFSNILSKSAIERLAQVDEFEVVREVQVRNSVVSFPQRIYNILQEYFADYAPISPCLFSQNHMPTVSKPLYGSTANSWDPKALDAAMQAITAVLLSLRKKPAIRYEKMSPMAKKLGLEIQVSLFLHLKD